MNGPKSLSVSDYSKGERFELGDNSGHKFIFWISDMDYSTNELILRNPYQEVRYNLIKDVCKIEKKLIGDQFGNILLFCN